MRTGKTVLRHRRDAGTQRERSPFPLVPPSKPAQVAAPIKNSALSRLGGESSFFSSRLRVSASKRKLSQTGGALLMVLWVSAALAAIGFSLASTVRGETERTGTAVDSLRSYYLAVGGIQRGMIELLWSAQYPGERTIPKGSTVVNYTFPRGGLMDCLSVYGSGDRVDANTASPAVLSAVGLSPYAVEALVTRRAQAPLTEGELMGFMAGLGAPANRLRVEGQSIVTMRATA